jgi:hypothetical protein
MNIFRPHSAQGLATAARPTADSGIRGPCPRRAPACPNRGHHARAPTVVARAPGSDGEPAGHGGRRRGAPWRSDVGGANEKLRGSDVLPGDGALAGYGQPWGSLQL